MGQGEDLLARVGQVVAEAADIVVANAAKPRTIRKKGTIDLVTETDLAVESFLKSTLSKIVPEADFLAEESAETLVPGALTWIIDPLDGTTNFAHGLPFVAISVALWKDGGPELAVVALPLLGETFSALRGGGARMNGEPISVSSTRTLSDSLLATGFPYDIPGHLQQILKNFERFLPVCQGIRRPGAAALDLCYVACGRYDGFWEPGLKPWDVAGGLLMVLEAGGRVSRYDETLDWTPGAPDVLASNGRIHPAMSALLAGRGD